MINLHAEFVPCFYLSEVQLEASIVATLYYSTTVPMFLSLAIILQRIMQLEMVLFYTGEKDYEN